MPQPPSPDRSRWTWLLTVPVLLLAAVPAYNRRDPQLGGLPFFYWFQLAVIPIGVLSTLLVSRALLRRRAALTGTGTGAGAGAGAGTGGTGPAADTDGPVPGGLR